jgi:hypothetical protein
VVEDGVIVGRIFLSAGRAAGSSMDVGQRPLGGHSQARGARLRADARGRDGGVREPNQGLPQDDDSGIVGTTRENPSMPPIVVLALGALAAGALIHRAVKEMRRINAELDRVKEGRAMTATACLKKRHRPKLRVDGSLFRRAASFEPLRSQRRDRYLCAFDLLEVRG